MSSAILLEFRIINLLLRFMVSRSRCLLDDDDGVGRPGLGLDGERGFCLMAGALPLQSGDGQGVDKRETNGRFLELAWRRRLPTLARERGGSGFLSQSALGTLAAAGGLCFLKRNIDCPRPKNQIVAMVTPEIEAFRLRDLSGRKGSIFSCDLVGMTPDRRSPAAPRSVWRTRRE